MRRRNGFTIVELLVAMALILFIMAILSQAFVSATSTFRNLKATGDLANKLRTVTTLLQRDLAADHFEGKKRLSNSHFWLNGPPAQGFFRIWQGSPGSTESYDLDNVPPSPPNLPGIGSYRSTDHMLAFSIKVRGNQMGDFLTAGQLGGGSVLSGNQFGPTEARYQPANTYNFQWGEVTWFLQPQVDPNSNIPDTTVAYTDPNTIPPTVYPPVPLYTLYRSQRLAVPDNTLVPTQTIPPQNLANFLQMSCWLNGTTNPAQIYFNSPMDLTVPTRRFGMVPTNPAGMLYALPYAYPNWINPPNPWPGIPWSSPTPPPYNLPPGPSPWGPYAPAQIPPGYPQVNPTPPYYPTLAQQAGGALSNSDIQLTDVVSFDVRVLHTGSLGTAPDPFVTLFDGTFGGYQNGNPYFSAPIGPRIFDTWTSINDLYSNYLQWNQPSQPTSIPLWNGSLSTGPTILAIQITIRIWDVKTYQTREVTLVQAM